MNHPIGTKFHPYGNKKRPVNVVIDYWTTRNNAGEVVKFEYVCEHVFCGQIVSDRFNHTAISRGLLK